MIILSGNSGPAGESIVQITEMTGRPFNQTDTLLVEVVMLLLVVLSDLSGESLLQRAECSPGIGECDQ